MNGPGCGLPAAGGVEPRDLGAREVWGNEDGGGDPEEGAANPALLIAAEKAVGAGAGIGEGVGKGDELDAGAGVVTDFPISAAPTFFALLNIPLPPIPEPDLDNLSFPEGGVTPCPGDLLFGAPNKELVLVGVFPCSISLLGVGLLPNRPANGAALSTVPIVSLKDVLDPKMLDVLGLVVESFGLGS